MDVGHPQSSGQLGDPCGMSLGDHTDHLKWASGCPHPPTPDPPPTRASPMLTDARAGRAGGGGAFGKGWRHFWSSPWGVGVLLTSTGRGQGCRQHPTMHSSTSGVPRLRCPGKGERPSGQDQSLEPLLLSTVSKYKFPRDAASMKIGGKRNLISFEYLPIVCCSGKPHPAAF